MIPPITAVYVGLAVLLLTALSAFLSVQRIRHSTSDGAIGMESVERASRAFGNCAAYLPLMLLLTATIESAGAPPAITHLFGVATLLTRFVHALATTLSLGVLRQSAMLFTLLLLACGGLGVVGHGLTPDLMPELMQ